MTKIVYNACYGGFSLSTEAIFLYGVLKGTPIYRWKDPKYKDSRMFGSFFFTKEPDPSWTEIPEDFWQYHFYDRDLERNDPILVQVVEQLGSERASGDCAELQIAEIPAGTPYRIDEYDGNESVETHDSYDWKIA